MTKTNKILIGVIIALILAFLIHLYFSKPSNQTIDNNIGTVKQTTEHITVNDSLRGISQDVLVTNNPDLIKHLTDSLQSKLLNEAGVKKPTVLIQYKDKFIDNPTDGKIMDSLSNEIDRLLARNSDSAITREEFAKYKATLLAKKFPYKIENKYRYETGSVDLNGNIHSDSLIVTSDPTISIGETGGFLKRKKIKVVVGNKNPLIHSDSLTSIVYLKPSNAVQFSVGPMILGSKTSLSAGAGIFIKKGILSIGLGYQFYNHKF